MAPYSRPKTQAFGYKPTQPKPSNPKKTVWNSEEVSSITGFKTMTALNPASSRPLKPKTI